MVCGGCRKAARRERIGETEDVQSAGDRFRAERFTSLLNARSPWQAEAGAAVREALAVSTVFHGNQALTPGAHAHAALREEDVPVQEWVARARVQRSRPLPRYLRRMSIAAADFRRLLRSLGFNVSPH